MTALRESQRWLARQVLDLAALPDGGTRPDTPAQRGLRIYREGIAERWREALATAFPLVAALAGKNYFRRIAGAYLRECPSAAGDLFPLGRQLPEFLQARLAGGPDEALVSASRLEWAIQVCLRAPDSAAVLDVGSLALVPAKRHADIRMDLHPAVGLLAVKHGVFAAWQALQAGSLDPDWLHPRPAEFLVIQRQAAGILLHRVPRSDYLLLAGLQAGWPLPLALADALAAGMPTPDSGVPSPSSPDPGALLARWVRAGVIVRFRLAGGAPSLPFHGVTP